MCGWGVVICLVLKNLEGRKSGFIVWGEVVHGIVLGFRRLFPIEISIRVYLRAFALYNLKTATAVMFCIKW